MLTLTTMTTTHTMGASSGYSSVMKMTRGVMKASRPWVTRGVMPCSARCRNRPAGHARACGWVGGRAHGTGADGGKRQCARAQGHWHSSRRPLTEEQQLGGHCAVAECQCLTSVGHRAGQELQVPSASARSGGWMDGRRRMRGGGAEGREGVKGGRTHARHEGTNTLTTRLTLLASVSRSSPPAAAAVALPRAPLAAAGFAADADAGAAAVPDGPAFHLPPVPSPPPAAAAAGAAAIDSEWTVRSGAPAPDAATRLTPGVVVA